MDNKKSKLYQIYSKYRKKVFKINFIFYPIAFLVAVIGFLYLRFVILTSKINYNIHLDDIKNLKKNNYILAFWHGRLLSAFFIRKYFNKSCVLISHNKSSYIVAVLAHLFSTSVIKGSSNKDGSKSVKHIVKLLKAGKNTVFAIAPDGSIGPRMRCNLGVITISSLSKTDILPITFSAKKGVILNSWDKFFIPYPFNNITLDLQQCIKITSENGSKKNLHDVRLELETVLNKITWNLDNNYGLQKIEPMDVDKKGHPLKLK